MNRYEVIYIIDSQVEDAPRQELIAKFNAIVEAQGGTVDKVDEWGKRRLAYVIDYKTDGYYVMLNITAPAELPKELERNFEINENILRYLVIKQVEKRSSVKPRPTPLRPAPMSQQESGAQPVVAPMPSPMPEITEPEAVTAPAPEAAPAAEDAPQEPAVQAEQAPEAGEEA